VVRDKIRSSSALPFWSYELVLTLTYHPAISLLLGRVCYQHSVPKGSRQRKRPQHIPEQRLQRPIPRHGERRKTSGQMGRERHICQGTVHRRIHEGGRQERAEEGEESLQLDQEEQVKDRNYAGAQGRKPRG